jgi:CheY-like chemotaxis protein
MSFVLSLAGVPVLADLRQKLRGVLRRAPARPPQPRTILIVDPNAEDRRRTARRVTRMQYRAVEAATAEEALDRLAESAPPNCVLLAMDLPDRPGLELLGELRQTAPDLEVVMLTRDWRDARTAEAMRRGAVAYLAKPFSQDDLREILR